MKLLIVGAGRMGIRHAIGASSVANIEKITIVDISAEALENARNQLLKLVTTFEFSYQLLNNIDLEKGSFDIGIIATTAEDRLTICEKVINLGCANILIEKPLGQNMESVLALSKFIKHTNANVFVNLNMRINPVFLKLKQDLKKMPQFDGQIKITLNTGSVGIGANGIHYLDFLIFLFDADKVVLRASEIDDTMILSSRGSHFKDFGGWCILDLFSDDLKVGSSYISMTATSSVFGGFDIVGTHGRITINESTGQRIDYLRNPESGKPIYYYHADYLEPNLTSFTSPELSELTKIWIESILEGNSVLPQINETLLAHKIMFQWLSQGESNKINFPIT
jgi:predicted dehydrogenase